MKYKLLKDLPWHSAGEILETDDTGKLIVRTIPGMLYPESFPKLFEPVIERWRADTGAGYFYLNYMTETNRITESLAAYDKRLFESGNYFKTREQAEEASKRIKKVLMDYHKEIGK